VTSNRASAPEDEAFPDQTVDFAEEILKTPPSDLAARIQRLSPDMRSTVLREVVLRYQKLDVWKRDAEREIQNLRYHTERLERMVYEMARGGKQG